MTDKESPQTARAGESGSHSGLSAHRVPIIVALIASVTSFAGLFLTYVFTERTRTEIAAQTLQLESIKVEISAAAQKTAEIAVGVDQARLELQRQIAKSAEHIESKKVQIEDRKGTTEEVRLTPDFTRLSSGLRPNLAISCAVDRIDRMRLQITCIFKNNGAHLARIEPKSFLMLNTSDQKEVPGAIEKVDNTGANNILPNNGGSSTYDVFLTSDGGARNKPMIRIEFDATTDSAAIAMTKRLSKGAITNNELRAFSTQGYIQYVRY